MFKAVFVRRTVFILRKKIIVNNIQYTYNINDGDFNEIIILTRNLCVTYFIITIDSFICYSRYRHVQMYITITAVITTYC